MVNKTFRLFISSTFDDFFAERELLNDVVFNKIDSFCQQRGYNFQLIDLRWGINNESAINQNTLAICLDEVKRCKEFSPKPNFLIMTGERYGWIPLPSKISKQKFEKILSVASDEEIKILSKWYFSDTNEIGGEYYLKIRTGEYVKNEIWADEEALIQKALLSCVVEKLKYNEEEAKTFISSATEHEIMEGLLNNTGVSNNTIALFRTGFYKKDADQTRIIRLKEKIVKKMSDDNTSQNILELEWSDDYLAKFEHIIIDVLKKNIAEEIKRLEQKQDANTEEDVAILENDISVLFDRSAEEKKIYDYVYGDNAVPLFLTGDSGSGKTTLLAEFIKKTDVKCVYSFYGLNDNSYTLVDAIKGIVEKLRNTFSITGIVEVTPRNLTEVLYKIIFSVPENEKVLIVIDGLDMFHDIYRIHQNVFPTFLPKNVKMVISSADNNIVSKFSDDSCCFFNISWFTPETSKNNLFESLRTRNRTISSDIQNDIISKSFSNGSTPLQIKLMTEICSAWHSDDTDIRMPYSAEDIALLHLENMYKKYGHNKELLLYTLSLIAAAPFGIMEEEILLLLFKFDSVKEYFISEDHHGHNLTKMPFAVWSRLFYDLKGCLTLSRFNGSIIVKFSHNIFYRVMIENFKDYYEQASIKLTEFYTNQKNYINEAKYPNARKCYNLPALLRKNEKSRELQCLLEDLHYVDSVIKIGNIDKLLDDIQYVIKNRGISQYLSKLYLCLQNNRSMLSCYKCEFFSCWVEDINIASIIQAESNVNNTDYVYFPYSKTSVVKWFNNGEKYAVINNHYVYICEQRSHSEYCSIFIAPQNKKLSFVKDLIWINKNTIALTTSNGEILVYEFSDNIPKIVAKTNTKSDFSHIRYSPKSEMLLYQDQNNICIFDLQKKETAYTIKIKKKSPIGFYVDEAEDILYFKDNQQGIKAINIRNGKELKKIKVKSNYGFGGMGTHFYNFSISKISTDKWVEQSVIYEYLVAILDEKKKKTQFLHPPYFSDISDVIIGKNTVLFIYPDFIISADLSFENTLGYYYIPKIKSVSWVEQDKKISILTEDGFFISELSNFTDSKNMAFVYKQNLFSSLSLTVKGLKKLIKYLIKIISISNADSYFHYKSVFDIGSPLYESPMQHLATDGNYHLTATIIQFAPDGKKAVAYEYNDAIYIFDKNEELIYKIEHLNLSIDNNILKLEFSPDSNKLLLWRNRSIQIIDLKSGKNVLYLDVTSRPVLNIWFRSDSKICIVLCDGKEYEFYFQNKHFKTTSVFPENLANSINSDDYFFSYGSFRQKDGIYAILAYANPETFDIFVLPSQWYKNEHIYNGANHWLYYKNGVFYLNGDKEKPFFSDFYDFNQCLQTEQMSDSTPFKSYIREKNDVMSSLIELDNNYIVLISRRFNSIIIFDISQMIIISAYKFNGCIIGDRMLDNKTVEIILDKSPYSRKIKLNLPK